MDPGLFPDFMDFLGWRLFVGIISISFSVLSSHAYAFALVCTLAFNRRRDPLCFSSIRRRTFEVTTK